MGAPKHPPEVRAKVMGALYASAEEVDGEILPNFSAVARRVGIDASVIHRWWGQRDKADDARSRNESIRARDEAREAGAKEWIESTLHELKQRVATIAGDTEKWGATAPAEASRGVKDLATAVKAVSEMIVGAQDVDGPNGRDGGGSAGAIDAAVRRSLDRARGVGPSGADG